LVQRWFAQPFKGSRFSAAAILKGGQSNPKRNSEKANTRLPCKVRWMYGIIESYIKLFKLTYTLFKALRAGRIMNVEYRSNEFSAVRLF